MRFSINALATTSVEGGLVNLAFLLLLVQSVLRRGQPVLAAKGPDRSFAKKEEGLLVGLQFFLLRVLSLALRLRWYTTQHFPISNLYESLLFLSLLLSFGVWALSRRGIPPRALGLIGLCPLLILGFGSFSLPPDLREAGPLVPALKSNWLLRHVTVRILSYAGLRLGSLRSIRYLAARRASQNTPLLERLEELSYRLIGFGFPFLTLGILSGAVWANETWGSYWSWDPKETWSLITWLVFAVYLHTRLVKGQTGENPAKVAAGGFILVWVCYLGVNLLGKGLHSYGWFS